MLLNLPLPCVNAYMTTAIIDHIYATTGEMIPVGGRFIDLTIDIGVTVPHDCPPVGHYRLALRDRVWLRRLNVAPGDEPAVGADLALFTTDRDEPLDGKPQRKVRLSIAGIVPETTWNQA